MVHTQIQYDTWADKYRPLRNTLVQDAPMDGFMFETFGEELEMIVMFMNDRQVWTWVDADGGTYIIPGYHYVNRIGYFLTEKEWEHEEVEVVVDDRE